MRSLLFLALLCAACDDGASSADMSVATCSDLCQRYATCYQAANPGFMGSSNALVPCENTCFSLSEQAREDLRTCNAKSCDEYLMCGMTAGLKLMPKPADASVDLSGID